jgi:hypothetical protein
MNTRIKSAQLACAVATLTLSAILIATGRPLAGLLCLTLCGLLLNKPKARLCAVTLSVPEILADLMAAFKLRLLEFFGPNGFTTDFKSETAVIGDVVTAKIDHTPVTAAYDPNNKGFYNGAQDVLTLIEDVPVVLNQLRHVPIKIGFLTGLATKGVNLYKSAVANQAWALLKYVLDQTLVTSLTSVSNSIQMFPVVTTLDTFDGALRNQCNAQKMFDDARFAIVNTALASALGADDRVRSNLFFGQRNGKQGVRRFTDVAGFKWIQEYPDFNFNGYGGLAGDRRLVVASVRKIEDVSKVVDQLGVRKLMNFHPLKDEETGLELTGISWQEGGTGDLYLSAAILFGTSVGNQGGIVGTKTDNAGLLIRTS